MLKHGQHANSSVQVHSETDLAKKFPGLGVEDGDPDIEPSQVCTRAHYYAEVPDHFRFAEGLLAVTLKVAWVVWRIRHGEVDRPDLAPVFEYVPDVVADGGTDSPKDLGGNVIGYGTMPGVRRNGTTEEV
jgi:hypothetical protein